MYPNDFLVSTAALTPTQGWAYTQLLMYAWTNGSIPDDRDACSRMTRCDLSENDWTVLRARFRVADDGTLSHPRLERERIDAQQRHVKASERASLAAAKRWAKPEGKDATGNAKASAKKAVAACSEHATSMPITTTITDTNPPTPQDGLTDVRERAGVYEFKWSPSNAQVDRIAKSTPTIATRLERAKAGDLWARELDGTRRQVSVDDVLADARSVASKAIADELKSVMQDLCGKGLAPKEAIVIWREWFTKWVTTGIRPQASMAAELADKTIRNHVAVWKRRAKGA